ncbi:MAG: hypothetical protein IT184_08820 [Acidobacteria bacterium]|nr:hypothetical protein [Acidobacteriota bacterium]
MKSSRLVFAVLLAAALAPAFVVQAAGPTFWTVATASEFLKGRSDGVYVSMAGVITAGPQLVNRLTSTPSQIWALAEGPDGSLWAGTGGDGQVIRLRPNQPDTTVFDSNENNVFALAVAGSRVYAATAPDGRVYAIEADGSARPFFDPEEKYIWALAVDPVGQLWVGAGNPAVIYRVDPNGTAQVVYRPPAAHVVTLARDASGRMLAGTDSPGRLYRFDASQKPFVVLDAGQAEMRAIAVDAASGALYAAAVLRSDDGSSSDTPTIAAAAAPTTPASTSASPRRSTLYCIDANGTWEAIWNAPDVIYDVAVDTDGVVAATGPAGRLYRVTPTRDVALLTGVDARQITKFVTNPKTRALAAFATANPGRIVSVGTGPQSPATYVSPVRDTSSSATWGLVRWEAVGAVTLSTRSGNTEQPDDSWSDWSAPYGTAQGQPIASPAARFLQWRATLTAAAGSPAQLTGVTVAYLTRNNRPVVQSVTVYPPGVVFQRPFVNEEGAVAGLDEAVANARRAPGDPGPPTPAPGRRMFQRGLQTITWKAEDDDETDRLVYSLEYRREGATEWQPLRTGLSDGIYVWDTTAVPDGRYLVRVRASDSVTNAVDRALAGDKESDPIDVDNTPPAIVTEVARQGAAVRLLVRVTDARSPIQKVEYSIGGGPWQLVYPQDGLADAPDERYEVPLDAGVDPARVVVRATDLLQNVTTRANTAR